MRFAIDKRGGRLPISEPEFTFVGDDRIIGSTIWQDEDGSRRESYQVLTIANGKIVDMQDCATRRKAERFARRH